MRGELISWGIVTQLIVIGSWMVLWSKVECLLVIKFISVFYKELRGHLTFLWEEVEWLLARLHSAGKLKWPFVSERNIWACFKIYCKLYICQIDRLIGSLTFLFLQYWPKAMKAEFGNKMWYCVAERKK